MGKFAANRKVVNISASVSGSGGPGGGKKKLAFREYVPSGEAIPKGLSGAVEDAVSRLQPCALKALAGDIYGDKDHEELTALIDALLLLEEEERISRFGSPGGWRWRLHDARLPRVATIPQGGQVREISSTVRSAGGWAQYHRRRRTRLIAASITITLLATLAAAAALFL